MSACSLPQGQQFIGGVKICSWPQTFLSPRVAVSRYKASPRKSKVEAITDYTSEPGPQLSILTQCCTVCSVCLSGSLYVPHGQFKFTFLSPPRSLSYLQLAYFRNLIVNNKKAMEPLKFLAN